ncbi:MAG TPA: hypothetical protein VJ697_08130 [Nitrososphaeraceae archaeon]|nr:hypothetical protein [Nitrososphaeraceae archaeon]
MSEFIQTEDGSGRGVCSLFRGSCVAFTFIVTKPVLELSRP